MAGSITIGQSEIENFGAVTAGTGGAITLENGTTIINAATATITVDGSLTLDDTSAISGGIVTIDGSGTLTLNGSSGLSDGTLNSSGQFTAAGSGNTLSDEW